MSPTDVSRASGQEPAIKTGGFVSKQLFWVLVILAVVVAGVGGFFLYKQLNRLQGQVASLSQQVERTNRAFERVSGEAGAAMRQASQAQTSAQQAAQQRDQAEKAEAQSQNAATLARQQANVAQNQAKAAQDQAKVAQNQAVVAQRAAEQYRQQRQEELDRLQQVLSQVADTRRTAMGLIMTLGNNSIRFDFDKANLRAGNREVLSRIAGILSTLRGYKISVFGYTDDVGTPQYNVQLSDRRANTVRNYLIKSGLNPNIITAKGFGESDPRVPGNSPAARAANRRVEIAIVDSSLQVQGVVNPKH
jgi:outer membrane protein OmpA-like peptidoglycan-associated protein